MSLRSRAPGELEAQQRVQAKGRELEMKRIEIELKRWRAQAQLWRGSLEEATELTEFEVGMLECLQEMLDR